MRLERVHVLVPRDRRKRFRGRPAPQAKLSPSRRSASFPLLSRRFRRLVFHRGRNRPPRSLFLAVSSDDFSRADRRLLFACETTTREKRRARIASRGDDTTTTVGNTRRTRRRRGTRTRGVFSSSPDASLMHSSSVDEGASVSSSGKASASSILSEDFRTRER